MGGGDHHGPPYTIPDWRKYRVENVPKLLRVKEMLAQKGLKDPWLRNEVWRYGAGTFWQRTLTFWTRGLPWGFGAAVVTVLVTEALGLGPKTHDHGHHDGHHESEHDDF